MSSYLQITNSGGRLQPKLLTYSEKDPHVIAFTDHVETFRYVASRVRVDMGVLVREARERLAGLAELESQLVKVKRKIGVIEVMLGEGISLLNRSEYQGLQLAAHSLIKQIASVKKELRSIWLEHHSLQKGAYPEAYRRYTHAERVATRVRRLKR